jgi:glycine betaine/choline ABC-type transport system substrate-binding protein
MTTGKKLGILGVIAGVLVLAVVVGLFTAQSADVTIGGKDFTEQSILGQIFAQMIEARTDLTVRHRPWLGGTMVCFNGLKTGSIDAYPEYTGTGLVSILKEPVLKDSRAAYEKVKTRFAEEYGLAWLEPLGFYNTYTLTMRGEQARELGIETFSDLAEYLRNPPEGGPVLQGGFTAEFLDREDGYEPLAAHYGLEFAEPPRQLDPGLMYKACADGTVDVICGFSTDGRIAKYDLVTLEDDKNFFPPYDVAPLVRQETLDAHPELEAVFEDLAGKISAEQMQRMNLAVDDRGRNAAEVAREFLLAEGLLEEPASEAANDAKD